MRIKGGPDSSVHGEDWRRLIRTVRLAEGPRSVNVGSCRYPRCYSRLPESSIDVIEVEFGDGGQDGQGRGVSVDAPYLWNVRTLVPGIFWEAMSVLTGD